MITASRSFGGGFVVVKVGEAMPRKAKRPCSFPGCPNLCEDLYCEKHAQAGEQERLERQRKYNRYERDKAVVKKYDGRYRKLRNLYIAQHPLCEECLKHGRRTPAEEVHHIKPVKWGGEHSFDNFMALCQACHTKLDKAIGAR